MAQRTKLAAVLNGLVRNIDITADELVLDSVRFGGLAGTLLTKTILDSLIANSHASGSDNQNIVAGSGLTGGGSGASVTLDVNVDDSTIEINSDQLRIKDGAISASKLNASAITGQTAETSADNADMLLVYDDSAAALKKMSRANFLSGTTTDEQVKVSANDTTAKYLEDSIVVANGTNTTNPLEMSTLNDGGDEDLQIKFDQSKVDHGSLAGLGDDDHTIYTKADGTRAFTGNQSMGSNKLTNVADPTVAQDAATKNYVDTNFTYTADGQGIEVSANQFNLELDGSTLSKSASGLKVASGGITNTEVNASAAIAESKLALDYSTSSLNTAISDHLSDSSDAHDASAISSVPAGNLSSTDVQAALNELDSEKVAKAGDTMSGNLAMGGNKVTGLGSPTASADAATKGYVDSVAEGLKPKTAARAATTANITIATDLNSGDVIDGVTLADGDRVLVKDQSTASQNGIYVVGATPARSTDFDSTSPIDEINGAMVAVEEGTDNAGKVFVQSGALVTAVGTDPINFVFFNSSSSLVGGDGITVSGSNISVDHDGEGLQFTATQLALELDGSTLSKSSSGLKVASGGITNTEINASAAIAYSKLALSNSIVNADISTSAAIALSKLAALTVSRALISNGSGEISVSSVTDTELGYVSGVTSAIQTQLNSKAADADVIKKNGSVDFTADQSMGGFKLTNLAAPTASTDAVTKAYADALAPSKVAKSFTAGESFSANTSYAVRIAMTGETAGRVYKADFDASVSDKFYAYGMIEGNGAAAKSAGDSVIVVMLGTITLGSSDTNFASGEIGQSVNLKAAGAWDASSQITYNTNEATYRLGVVQEVDKILVGNMQLVGIN